MRVFRVPNMCWAFDVHLTLNPHSNGLKSALQF